MRALMLSFGVIALAIPARIYGQITSEAESCTMITAATDTLGPDAGTVISIRRWSVSVSPWTYEIETSSGAQFVIDTAGTILEQTREAVSMSRKQLERLSIARAIEAEQVPSVCELLARHFEVLPSSVVLEVSFGYEYGEIEAEIRYWRSFADRRERDASWEWEAVPESDDRS